MQKITRKKRWQWFVRPDGRVESIRATLHNGNAKEYEDKRELYEEFKELTNVFMVHGYKGWITDTLAQYHENASEIRSAALSG